MRSSFTVNARVHRSRSGDFLFRWRGQLPILLLPLFLLGLIEAGLPAALPPGVRAWQWFSLAIALSGLAVRVVAVGTAPPGTSERSTTSPRASRLRTTGLYSVMRHPLYAGNLVTAVGLALFTTSWFVPAVVLAVGVLYHRAIAAHEEAFLEERFGGAFADWRRRVPPFVPRLSGYVPSDTPFSWRRAAGREFHGLLVIGSVLFVLDLTRSALATGRLVFDPAWTGVFLLTAVVFVVCRTLKRTGSLGGGQ